MNYCFGCNRTIAHGMKEKNKRDFIDGMNNFNEELTYGYIWNRKSKSTLH